MDDYARPPPPVPALSSSSSSSVRYRSGPTRSQCRKVCTPDRTQSFPAPRSVAAGSSQQGGHFPPGPNRKHLHHPGSSRREQGPAASRSLHQHPAAELRSTMWVETKGGESQDAPYSSQKTVAGTGTGSRDEDVQALKLLAVVVDRLQRFKVPNQQRSTSPPKISLRSSTSPKMAHTPPMPYLGPIFSPSSSSSASSVSSREDNLTGQTQTAVRCDSTHKMPGGRRQERVRLSSGSSSGEPLEEQQDCGSPGALSSSRGRNM